MNPIYLVLIFSLMPVGSSAYADPFNEKDVASCLAGMVRLEKYAYPDPLDPGRLPAQVKTPKGTLSGWRRADGEVLISDGTHIFTAGNPSGESNGLFYGQDPNPGEPAGHEATATFFRRIQLPDGSTLDLHRTSDQKHDYFRTFQQDEELIRHDRDREMRHRRASLLQLAEALDKYQKDCDEANKPEVDKNLNHFLNGLFLAIVAGPSHSERLEVLGAEERPLAYYAEQLEKGDRDRAKFDAAEASLQKMRAQAENPANAIVAAPFSNKSEDLAGVLKEAKGKFLSSVRAEQVAFVDMRAELAAACGSLVSFPVPVKDPFTRGVESAIKAGF
jgi:hypothetical protein